jgi:succinoglycan biosynthesis transport protein ExoP
MDTTDRSNSNLPAHFHAPLARQLDFTPALSADQSGTPAPQINPQVILRALSRHWWRILALWFMVSAPIALLLYLFIQPTYEAFSLLRIEPAQPEIFGPLRERDGGDFRSTTYLTTQLGLITSEKVLNPAVADPAVVHLPWIAKSDDPKQGLRKKLVAEIVENTNLIRVALELPDPDEAVTIVKAVVQSYLSQNNDYSRSANRDLTESLKQQIVKLGAEIDGKKSLLKELVRKGKVAVVKPEEMLNTKNEGDSSQATFKRLSEGQIQQLISQMVTTDLELFEAQSRLSVKVAANQPGTAENDERGEDAPDLEARIAAEFHEDPDVQALINGLQEKGDYLQHLKDVTRQNHDPALMAAQREVTKLQKQYDLTWQQMYKPIRLRLQSGANKGSDARPTESVAELTEKVAVLTMLKDKQLALFKVMQVEQRETNDDTFEATYLTKQIDSLMGLEQQVQRNLEQLRFEANQDKYRVVLVDPASASKSPSNNKRLKYMAVAPVGVMFLMLGLFLLFEVKAERVADPDALSSRVRSEVYALPPLPTARSIRKLSVSEADDQIEQFIQRLDHLRFAVCRTPSQLGKGRCVLITSAIGGEGKTTLAAQLAARCGNAGMSTLLIDSDFRRGALCPLLDVPEGPGLSDLLKEEATIDEVTIPVQGGTFYLLPAGTPIQDTSRVLQSPKFGQIISQLRELYDLIIIDSPPVLPVPDALILGRWADGAVIAARYDISRFPQVERARRQLDNAGIAVLGTVINGMHHSDSYYGRYTYSRRRSNQPDSSNAL